MKDRTQLYIVLAIVGAWSYWLSKSWKLALVGVTGFFLVTMIIGANSGSDTASVNNLP